MAREAKFSWRKITHVLNVKILEVQSFRSNAIIFFKGHVQRKNIKKKQRMIKKKQKQKECYTVKSIMLF